MGDGAKGFAYVGGVGDIAVGGEKNSAETVGVTGVAVGSFGRVYGAVIGRERERFS